MATEVDGHTMLAERVFKASVLHHGDGVVASYNGSVVLADTGSQLTVKLRQSLLRGLAKHIVAGRSNRVVG